MVRTRHYTQRNCYTAVTMQDKRDEIKAIVQSVNGTAMQRLIAVLEAAGITDTAELADTIGCTPRAVQKARRSEPQFVEPCAEQRTPVRRSEPQFANPSSRTPVRKTNPSSYNRARNNEPQFAEANPSSPVDIPPHPPKIKTTTLPSGESSVPLHHRRCGQRDRGSRLPCEWTLPADWMTWTRTTFPAVTAQRVELEAERFRDFWVAKTGQGATKLDWQATWRNWCRTAFASGGRVPRYTPSEWADRPSKPTLGSLLRQGGTA